MQRSNNRRRAYRRQQQRKRMIITAAAAAVLILVIVHIVLLIPRGTDKPGAVQANNPTISPTPSVAADVTPTPTPTIAPSPTPSNPYAKNSVYRPTAKDGWLPVFKKAETNEKIIAITVDDCFQAE